MSVAAAASVAAVPAANAMVEYETWFQRIPGFLRWSATLVIGWLVISSG